MTLTLELESWSRESNAARSFLSLRSMMAICPTGFSAATASVEPLLHAKGQELGSPVQLAASDDLMRLKQLLHMTSRSSMSFAAPCARFGRAGFGLAGLCEGMATLAAWGIVPPRRAAA